MYCIKISGLSHTYIKMGNKRNKIPAVQSTRLRLQVPEIAVAVIPHVMDNGKADNWNRYDVIRCARRGKVWERTKRMAGPVSIEDAGKIANAYAEKHRMKFLGIKTDIARYRTESVAQ